jgi:hypothetical protein
MVIGDGLSLPGGELEAVSVHIAVVIVLPIVVSSPT